MSISNFSFSGSNPAQPKDIITRTWMLCEKNPALARKAFCIVTSKTPHVKDPPVVLLCPNVKSHRMNLSQVEATYDLAKLLINELNIARTEGAHAKSWKIIKRDLERLYDQNISQQTNLIIEEKQNRKIEKQTEKMRLMEKTESEQEPTLDINEGALDETQLMVTIEKASNEATLEMLCAISNTRLQKEIMIRDAFTKIFLSIRLKNYEMSNIPMEVIFETGQGFPTTFLYQDKPLQFDVKAVLLNEIVYYRTKDKEAWLDVRDHLIAYCSKKLHRGDAVEPEPFPEKALQSLLPLTKSYIEDLTLLLWELYSDAIRYHLFASTIRMMQKIEALYPSMQQSIDFKKLVCFSMCFLCKMNLDAYHPFFESSHVLAKLECWMLTHIKVREVTDLNLLDDLIENAPVDALKSNANGKTFKTDMAEQVAKALGYKDATSLKMILTQK